MTNLIESSKVKHDIVGLSLPQGTVTKHTISSYSTKISFCFYTTRKGA